MLFRSVENTAGRFNPSISGAGLINVTYSYTNTYGCFSNSFRTIHVFPGQSFICGNFLTDVRDGHRYSTFQLSNGKCWMKENLYFGYRISDLVPQTDNCTAEFYINPGSPVSNPTSFYQWDELMRYDPAPGSQGLCPPGWHVPSAAEWDELLILNMGASQAAGPLKDLYLPDGFHAIPTGFNYLNRTWAFSGVPLSGSFFWTSTGDGSTDAIARGLNSENASVSLYSGSRANAFSVRCLKDQ